MIFSFLRFGGVVEGRFRERITRLWFLKIQCARTGSGEDRQARVSLGASIGGRVLEFGGTVW